MSTITRPTTPFSSTISRPLRRGVVVAVSAIVVIAAAIALTGWLLVGSPAQHAKITGPPQTNVQKFGLADLAGNPETSNVACPPAMGTHFC
jgi:hypothetical protein